MGKFRTIARLDIKNEFVVKGKQMDGLRKLGDPNHFALKYYEDGADEILFVDVVAAYYDRSSMFNIIETASRNVFIPITVCGGVRVLSDIEKLLRSGADKVAINSAAILNPNFLSEAVKVFGSQSILSSIEFSRCSSRQPWVVFYDNGRENSGLLVTEWAKRVQDLGVGEILLTSVVRDGMMNGLEIGLIREVSSVCKVPLLVGGGLGLLEHLSFFLEEGSPDAIVSASALHYGVLSVTEIKNGLRT